MTPLDADNTKTAKRAIRREVLGRRATLDEQDVAAAADRLADQVVALLPADARVVTAYLSLGTEPGTRPLVDKLDERGITVLLPIVTPDLDLDWAQYDPAELAESDKGLVEPTGPRLGLEAIERADVIVCPGVTATADGSRLGRGGGCYDKALARSRPDAARYLLLYDGEVADELPTEAHDQRVDVIVTPTTVTQTGAR